MKKGYTFVDHTADIGIEAWGVSLEGLFANAANGLRDLILEPLEERPALTEVEVVLEGLDQEELLVNWLNEILFIFETRHFVPVAFEVLHVGGSGMSARISGFPLEGWIAIHREVKAATYHRLKLEQVKDGWRARVFVDI